MTAVWVVRDNGKVEAAFPREDDAVDYRFLYGAADMTVTRGTLLTPAHAAVIEAAVAWLDVGGGSLVELVFAVKNLRKLEAEV